MPLDKIECTLHEELLFVDLGQVTHTHMLSLSLPPLSIDPDED